MPLGLLCEQPGPWAEPEPRSPPAALDPAPALAGCAPSSERPDPSASRVNGDARFLAL